MNYKLFLLLSFVYFFFTQPAHAEHVAGSSAMLSIDSSFVKKEDNRIKLLKAYLEKNNSPLKDEASTFILTADTYGLDYRLLPAIAGVESGFGKYIPYNSYNGWGWGIYGDKTTYFTSWNEAIKTISKELKDRYMDGWGAKDVYTIGSYYAADPLWASKVNHYMEEIALFSENEQSKAISISI